MKAAQLVGPKRFEFMDVETPVLNDGECLVKLERWSVCGSDIRHGYGPILPEEQYPMPMGSPGHEIAGVVVESRTGQIREGQRVIVIPAPPAAQGGLVEYIASSPSRMIPLPDHGDLTDWVMCQPSGTVLYSCQQMGNMLGKNVVVLGQGSIGLSFTMLLSRQGARQVVAVDPLEYRLEFSRRFGSTHTINPDKEDLREAVQELTRGVGPDIVVEAAGYAETLNMTFELVRPFGTAILFGVTEDRMVPVNTGALSNKTIIKTSGASSGNPTRHIEDIVALRERGWCDPAQLVTHRLSFNVGDVNTAYEMYEQRLDNVIKVVMSA